MKRDKKLCVINNIAPHYRRGIYKLMEEELDCDFYFGDHVESNIKTLSQNDLKNYKRTLRNLFFSHFYWQKGSVSLLFKPYKYYILEGEPYCLSSWVILLLAKLLNKKTMPWSHGWYGREGAVKRFIKRRYFHLFSALMIYSEYAIGLMEKEGFKKEKMYCIANSLDSDAEKEIRQQLHQTDVYTSHFHNDYPTIIYCGRIQKSKKLEMIVDAVKQMGQKGIHVNAVFVGKDVEGVKLDDYAAQQGAAEQVWMYGPCYDDHILGELFYNANVCVSPGNVGLTAIHSLTFGCPVISHNNFPYQGPEFESIRPGITGDFFEQGNSQSLQAAVEAWTTKTPQEREHTRQEAFNEVDRKWNIHYQIEIIKKAINEL